MLNAAGGVLPFSEEERHSHAGCPPGSRPAIDSAQVILFRQSPTSTKNLLLGLKPPDHRVAAASAPLTRQVKRNRRTTSCGQATLAERTANAPCYVHNNSEGSAPSAAAIFARTRMVGFRTPRSTPLTNMRCRQASSANSSRERPASSRKRLRFRPTRHLTSIAG